MPIKNEKLRAPDGMDFMCERFMQHLKKDHRGHKAEIHARELTKTLKRFAVAYGMAENELLDAILRRGWLEPIGSLSYHINYEAVRK